MSWVDDTHGLGIVGSSGRGTAQIYGVENRIHLNVGMLSKTAGAVGGYCATSRKIAQYLRHYARSYFFSTALPAPIVAGLNEIFKLLENGEIDAIFADDSMLYGILSDNKGYKILPKRYTKEYYSIALRQSQESDELERAVNDSLSVMQEGGILNKIKSRWIPNLHS